jgi:hypothetical protein
MYARASFVADRGRHESCHRYVQQTRGEVVDLSVARITTAGFSATGSLSRKDYGIDFIVPMAAWWLRDQ